jgi:hypothetical protein
MAIIAIISPYVIIFLHRVPHLFSFFINVEYTCKDDDLDTLCRNFLTGRKMHELSCYNAPLTGGMRGKKTDRKKV